MPGAQVVAQDVQRRELVLGKVGAVVDARERLPDLLVQRIVRLHGEGPFRLRGRFSRDFRRTRRRNLRHTDRFRLGLGFRPFDRLRGRKRDRLVSLSNHRFRYRLQFGFFAPGLIGNLLVEGLEAAREEVEPQAGEGQERDGRDDEAHEIDAAVHERAARAAAEAAAEQRLPSGQPAHKRQEPGADERAREGVDKPFSQRNPELGNGPAEGPCHEEGDQAERGEAEAPRHEEAAPAEAQLGAGVGDGGVAFQQGRFRQEAGVLLPGEEIRPHRDGGEEGEDTQQDSGDDPVFGPPLLVEFCPIGGGTFQFHFFFPFFL